MFLQGEKIENKTSVDKAGVQVDADLIVEAFRSHSIVDGWTGVAFTELEAAHVHGQRFLDDIVEFLNARITRARSVLRRQLLLARILGIVGGVQPIDETIENFERIGSQFGVIYKTTNLI